MQRSVRGVVNIDWAAVSLSVCVLLNAGLLIYNITSARNLRTGWRKFTELWAEYLEEHSDMRETRTMLELREIEAKVLVEYLRERGL